MTECIFCSLEEGVERNILWENESFRVIVDQFPVSYGVRLILPKRHVEEIDSLNEEEFMDLRETIVTAKKNPKETSIPEKYSKILENPISDKSKKFVEDVFDSSYSKQKPDGFNIGVNEGEAAGQTIDHLHIHVIPRYKGDVENPKGGIRNVIPEKSDYT